MFEQFQGAAFDAVGWKETVPLCIHVYFVIIHYLKLFKHNLANHFEYKCTNSKCLPPSHAN